MRSFVGPNMHSYLPEKKKSYEIFYLYARLRVAPQVFNVVCMLPSTKHQQSRDTAVTSGPILDKWTLKGGLQA